MQFPKMGMHFRSNAQRNFPFQHIFLNVLFHSPNCETAHWGIDCKVSEISNSDICRMVFSLQISASAFFVSTWSKRRRDIRELTLESSRTRVVGSSEPIVVLKGRNGSTLCVVYWNSLYLRPHNTYQRTLDPVPLLLVGARLLSVKEYVEKYRVMFHYLPLFTLSAQTP